MARQQTKCNRKKLHQEKYIFYYFSEGLFQNLIDRLEKIPP